MVNAPTVGVLALQGDVREHRRILESLGAGTVAVRTADQLDAIDGLVIPGGESTTMWRLARSFGLLGPVRKRLQAGLPAYGSCAGLIMLADRIEDGVPGQETFGGLDVTVRRNAFGRQVDSFEAELDYPAIGEPPLNAVFIRAPWVEQVGNQVEVLARTSYEHAHGRPPASAQTSASAGDPPASTQTSASAGRRIVAVRAGGLFATSFHPELTADTRVHAHFLEIIKEA